MNPYAYVLMPCSASAGAAETADGAVARMRMVLFSFTIAYYTKNGWGAAKLRENAGRASPKSAAESAAGLAGVEAFEGDERRRIS